MISDDGKRNLNKEAEENKGSFQFNLGAKNPFKYDSSDDEDGNDEPNKKSHTTDIQAKGIIFTRQKDDRFFFRHNDPRFEGISHTFWQFINSFKENEFQHMVFFVSHFRSGTIFQK